VHGNSDSGFAMVEVEAVPIFQFREKGRGGQKSVVSPTQMLAERFKQRRKKKYKIASVLKTVTESGIHNFCKAEGGL